MKNAKTIYELIGGEEWLIDEAITYLNDFDKSLINLRYGSDLHNPDTSNWDKKYNGRFYSTLIPKIKKNMMAILEGRKFSKGRVISTIYELLSPYSKGEVDKVLSELDDSSKHLIFLRYGSDLNAPDTSNWSMEYHALFYRSLLPKIRVRLKNNRLIERDTYKKIRRYYNEEVMDLISKIECLSFNDNLELNYDNPNLVLLKRILIVLKAIKSEHKELFNMITLKEYLIFVVTLKMDNYTLNDVMKLFKVSKEEIDNIRYGLFGLIRYSNLEDLMGDLNQYNYFLELVTKLKEEINTNYQNLLKVFREKDVLIFILVRKMDNNYSLMDIENYFKVTNEEIKKIITKMLRYLNYYKDYFGNFEELIRK